MTSPVSGSHSASRARRGDAGSGSRSVPGSRARGRASPGRDGVHEPSGEDRGLDIGPVCASACDARSRRTIVETGLALGVVAGDPPVTALARDPQLLGYVRHRAPLIEHPLDQHQPAVERQPSITVRHEDLRFVVQTAISTVPRRSSRVTDRTSPTSWPSTPRARRRRPAWCRRRPGAVGAPRQRHEDRVRRRRRRRRPGPCPAPGRRRPSRRWRRPSRSLTRGQRALPVAGGVALADLGRPRRRTRPGEVRGVGSRPRRRRRGPRPLARAPSRSPTPAWT